MNKQETLEEVKVVKRTELYNSILSIVKQIPRKEVEGDAMDAPSCTYELEQLFYKRQAERMYSEEEVIDFLQEMNDWPTTFEGRIEIREWFKQHKKK